MKGKNSLLTNKYVLYTVSFISFMNILGYFNAQRYDCLATFLIVAILVNKYNNNMTIVLLTSIIISSVICFRHHNLDTFISGNLKNKSCSNNIISNIKNLFGLKEGFDESKDEKDESKKCWINKDNKWESTDKNKDACDKIQGSCWGVQSSSCAKGSKKSEDALKNAKPINNNKNVDKDDDDDDGGMAPRIDYASTLEESYNNLNNILGKDGMRGLSKDTEKLVNQQKMLMETLESMAPMMKNAQSTLDGLDIGKLTSMAKALQPKKK